MRYTRVSTASYVIASVLLLVAVGVAWTRSRVVQAAPATADSVSMAAVPPPGTVAAEHSGLAADSAIYIRDCRSCHGAGEASGRRIPPLRGHTVTLFASEGGRDYLIDLVFDGRVRTLDKDGVAYRQSHPPFGDLTNAEIAAVLNYLLTAWGNGALLPTGTRMYTADEVGRRRPRG